MMRASLRATSSSSQVQRRRAETVLTFDLDSGAVNATKLTRAPAPAPSSSETTAAPTDAPHQENPFTGSPDATRTSSSEGNDSTQGPTTLPDVTAQTTSGPTTQSPYWTKPKDNPQAGSNNTISSNSTGGAPQDTNVTATDGAPQEQTTQGESDGILKSLRLYDDLRARSPGDFRRGEGDYVNVDLLSTPEGEVAFCHLSSMISFTLGDDVPWLTAFEDAAVIAMAIQHLNTGDGRIVPEVEGLNQRCNVRFTAEFADTEFSGGVTLNQVVHQTSRQPGTKDRIPCAFVGAYRSAVSLPMSIVTGLLGYPQISGASTSADLDDKSQYPLFGRTIPADSGNAIPIVRYIREVFDVTHLAVINVNDAYGNAYVQGMRKAAARYAPDLAIHQIPLDDDPASIPGAVDSLVQSKFRYVFTIVFTTETHDALLTEAYNKGVAGDGKHTWLFADSFLGTLDGRTFTRDGPLHKAYQGVGVFEVTGGIDGMPKYDSFVEAVAELHNPTDLSYLGSLFPKKDNPKYATQGTPPFVKKDDYLTHITSVYAPFDYEAVIGLGLAACNASQTHLNFTGQEHFDSFRYATFTGFSGTVIFDTATGTRDPRSALYEVINYVADDVTDKDTGKTVIQFNPVVTDLFLKGNWTQQTDYTFNSGTSNLLPDLPPPPSSDNGLGLGLSIGIPVAIVAILGVIVFLFYENKRKKNDGVWQVKKEDLVFGDPPQIIGRGTFGLILLAEYRGTQVAVKRVIPPKIDKKGRDIANTRDTRVGGESGSAISGTNSGVSAETESSGAHDNAPNIGTSSGMHSHSYNSGMNGSAKRGMSSGIGPSNFGDPSSWAISGAMSGMGNMLAAGFGKKSQMPKGRMMESEAAVWKRLKQEFVSEMRYLSKLRHPCITTVMGAVTVGEPMLIMEYMDHGSLYDLLHNETMVIEGELLLPILRDITQGVRFLHSSDPQVIHGDLKAANVLVDSRFRAKVADFGLSQKKNLGGTGTPLWMAPELLRMETTNTPASDVYSMGVILYEVYSRRDPYEGEDPKDVLRLVADKAVRKRPPIPLHMPDQLKGLMTDCLEEEAEKRPSFEELDTRLKRVDAKTVDPGQVVNKAISLFDIFPRHIAEALRDGRSVEPEHKESVTIFFSDIVGFTTMSSELHPRKVASMLDRLYTKFDDLSHNKHDIFKVETIGDAYMCVTNLVKDQADDHAKRIAEFAIDAIGAANSTLIDQDNPDKGCVNIRVGFHSGPVVADVVGTRNPRYCLFGDTVNTASRMESNSEQNRIHCSNAAAKLLYKQCPDLPLSCRGAIKIKGKGEMKTWWVNEVSKRNSSKQVPRSSEFFVKNQLTIETLQEGISEEFISSEFLENRNTNDIPETALA